MELMMGTEPQQKTRLRLKERQKSQKIRKLLEKTRNPKIMKLKNLKRQIASSRLLDRYVLQI